MNGFKVANPGIFIFGRPLALLTISAEQCTEIISMVYTAPPSGKTDLLKQTPNLTMCLAMLVGLGA